MEVSWNGGTPSYHPFIDGIFPYKPSIDRGTPLHFQNALLVGPAAAPERLCGA